MGNFEEQPDSGIRQASLMRQRRFLPFFCTQFLGAFNDNVYKNALILLIAYESLRYTSIDTDLLNNVAAGLFILPFFLFSAFAGQLADKFEKSAYIRAIKVAEIIIMCLAALSFYLQSLWGLLGILFLMGSQSAFFGPVKYSIIPQHLAEDELITGNAYVEMGTFLAILLGTAGAGMLMLMEQATFFVSIMVCALAILGRLTSQWIPEAKPAAPELTVEVRPLRLMQKTLGYARADRTVFVAILGISWFWFLGASYLTQLPNYTIEVLGSGKSVVTLLLCAFSVGIGIGSMLCAQLSGQKVEPGIVPLGALGLTLFGADLYFASGMPVTEELRTLGQFIQLPGAYRILLDMTLVGVFGGMFIVPLYAMIQQRTPAELRARVVAANNILNALLMVLAAVAGIILLGVVELSKSQYFLVLALANGVVASLIFSSVPEFLMRFIIWLTGRVCYRVKPHGVPGIPDAGPAVLVCNQISALDALLISGVIRRSIHFVVPEPVYHMPILNFVLRNAGAIPLVSRDDDPQTFELAHDQISQLLGEGQLICILAGGGTSPVVDSSEFMLNLERILTRNPAPVIPVVLAVPGSEEAAGNRAQGLSRSPGRLFARVDLSIGDLIEPALVSGDVLSLHLSNLLRSNAPGDVVH